MKYLEENQFYSNADLADWFCIKPDSFRRTKKQKLELLKHFADFEEVKGKVLITEVYIPEYNKDIKKLIKQDFYIDKVQNQVAANNLQNYTSLATNISIDYPDELQQLHHNSFKTVYYHTNKVTKSMFLGLDDNPPTHGRCLGKKWCKKNYDEKDHIIFIPMLNTEYQDWCKIRNKKSEIITEQQKEIVDSFELGEINEKELRFMTSDIFVKNYIYGARDEFYDAYGLFPGLAQEFELSAF